MMMMIMINMKRFVASVRYPTPPKNSLKFVNNFMSCPADTLMPRQTKGKYNLISGISRVKK